MKLTVLACVFMACLAYAYDSYTKVAAIQVQLDAVREMKADKMCLPLPKI
jgi:hypothetical protein